MPARPKNTDAEFWALLRATKPKRRAGNNRTRRRKRPTPGKRFRQVFFFLRHTGARPGEMAALTRDDVNLENRVIVLRRHETVRTQRTPKPRVIQLVPLAVKLLKRTREQQPSGSKRVLLTSHGTSWNRSNLALRVKRLRERASLPDDVTLSGIRHHFGTQSVINGVDIVDSGIANGTVQSVFSRESGLPLVALVPLAMQA